METSVDQRHLSVAAQSAYDAQIDAFVQSPSFDRLESGLLLAAEYDRFLLNVVATHAKSPQLLAFLFSVAPPAAAANVRANMLEELGIADRTGTAHPTMLQDLLAGAGLLDQLDACQARAESALRQQVVEPLLYGTLMEVGLAALIEVTAFEYMLARLADRIAAALRAYRHLDADTVEWFTHHGAVDVEHAQAGLRNLDHYVDYYGVHERDAETILEITLRENVFAKRYFADLAALPTSGSAS
jgi:hypothetical protein